MARATLLAVVAACGLSGCGTVMNVSGGCCGASSPKVVYGGVLLDAANAVEYAGKMREAKGPADAMATAAFGLFFLGVDLPLSIVGDTATLPVTLLASVIRLSEKGQRDDPPVPSAPTSAGSSARPDSASP